MSRRPWYKRYPSDFIAGTIMLSAEEKGVYGIIIDLLYDRRRSIEDVPKELARMCGCSVRRYCAIRDRLAQIGKITIADGHISNGRFERQAVAEQKEAEKFAQNGQKGGEKTAEKMVDLFNPNGLPKKPVHHNHMPNTISNTESSPRAKRRAPRAMISPTWVPTPEDRAYAENKGFAEPKISQMAAAFVNHHRSRGTLIADLAATWRTWCTNEVKFENDRKARAAGNGRGTSLAAMARGEA